MIVVVVLCGMVTVAQVAPGDICAHALDMTTVLHARWCLLQQVEGR